MFLLIINLCPYFDLQEAQIHRKTIAINYLSTLESTACLSFKRPINKCILTYEIIWIFIFKANPQGSSSVTQNGHGENNDDHTSNGAPEKEAVDIKDVELTLLPSYLHEQESVNVIDNTDLLQSISKPNPQLSPPKRPPRSNHSPEGNYANFILYYY